MLALHVTHVLDTVTHYIVAVIMLYIETVDVPMLYNSAVDVFGTRTHKQTVWYCSTHTRTHTQTVWNNDVGCHGV